MYVDVTEYRKFYASPLGALTARLIAARVAALWPSLENCSVVGFGFAPPYLDRLNGTPARLLAFMPARQGVVAWPPDWPNRAALVEESVIPAPDNSIDRLLVVHGLEYSRSPRQLWRDMWRALAPDGRLIVVVPNRQGLWARRDITPFGHGSPYSAGQLERAMRDLLFKPVSWSGALLGPPSHRRPAQKLLVGLEPLSPGWWRKFAGVLIVEAQKQIYGAEPLVEAKPAVRPVGVIES